MKKVSHRIYDFLNNPSNFSGYAVQGFIFLLIIVSVGATLWEWINPLKAEKYSEIIFQFDQIVLWIFTLEYVTRVVTAPKKLKFIFSFYGIVDFVAIAPFYLFAENTGIVRVFRLVRLLKFLKILKLTNILKFQNTILQKILPLLIFVAFLKTLVWVLEIKGFWITDQNLGELFAITGFFLGIILSQKVSVTHGKYIEVEGSLLRLKGALHFLKDLFEQQKITSGKKILESWTHEYCDIITKGDTFSLPPSHKKLGLVIAEIEKVPSELTLFFKDLTESATFCLGKNILKTPVAYDNLLQQALILYFILMAFFIPSMVGMISLIIATYMLYGMYYVTQDFDSLVGGEHDLINLDISFLRPRDK